jgi:hypothetical protein
VLNYVSTNAGELPIVRMGQPMTRQANISRWGVTVVIAIVLPFITGAQRVYEALDLKKDVRDSELVVHGVIRDVRTEMMLYDDLFVDERPHLEFPVTVIEVEIRAIIKGSWDSPAVRAVLPGDPKLGGFSTSTTYNYQSGEEVILCLHYDPKIIGDKYRLWGDAGSFVKRGETWQVRDGSASVSPIDIQALAQSVEPRPLVKDADAVILGTVEELDVREFDCGFPITCIADYATFRVTRGWKGPSSGDTILVRALRRGTNLPWFAPVPPLAVGEEYLMFLKRDDVGYYPYVGFNGFLKVQGEKLIMNGYVEYRLSSSRMLVAIQEEVGQ